jgi:hypothetical protein
MTNLQKLFLILLLTYALITRKSIKCSINDDDDYDTEPSGSILVETTVENIYLRLENGQILFGNRKLLTHITAKKLLVKRIVYEFLSLPFAEAPLGERRFQPPTRLSKTLPTDTYNATYIRTPCMQVIFPLLLRDGRPKYLYAYLK